VAGVIGLIVYAVARTTAPFPLHLIVAGDAFFAVYLVSTAFLAYGATPADLRQHARYEDEGVMVILLLTACAVTLCLTAIFLLLGEEGPPDALPLVLAVLSVLLGWFTVHTIAAFRYAHLYYTPDASAKTGYTQGLDFPGDDEPDMSDFLYYSFVIGMTSQVSDVQAQSQRLRRTTLAHSIISFFFNTVILALAVNIAAGFAH
jgi:uncharacterized membrane protein